MRVACAWGIALAGCLVALPLAHGQARALSPRQLARCWTRWAHHTPRPRVQGPCARSGADCVDRPESEDLDLDELYSCLTRGGDTTTHVAASPERSEHVAACLRARARSTRPALDVAACGELATLDDRLLDPADIAPGVQLVIATTAYAPLLRDVAVASVDALRACRAQHEIAAASVHVEIGPDGVHAATIPVETLAPEASACVVAALETARVPPRVASVAAQHAITGALRIVLTSP